VSAKYAYSEHCVNQQKNYILHSNLNKSHQKFNSKTQHFSDERDRIQKKTFTKWVNKHLAKEGHLVEDLFVDLQNGRNLIALLEALTSDRLVSFLYFPKIITYFQPKEHGETRFHRTQNVQVCLDYLRRRHVSSLGFI
jgi:hypothetical protein